MSLVIELIVNAETGYDNDSDSKPIQTLFDPNEPIILTKDNCALDPTKARIENLSERDRELGIAIKNVTDRLLKDGFSTNKEGKIFTLCFMSSLYNFKGADPMSGVYLKVNGNNSDSFRVCHSEYTIIEHIGSLPHTKANWSTANISRFNTYSSGNFTLKEDYETINNSN